MLKLKAALKKEAKDLTDEEKALVQKHWDLLNDDLREHFKFVAPEAQANDDDDKEDPKDDKEKGIDEDTLKEMISKANREGLEKAADEITDTLIERFEARAKAQRGKFLGTDNPDKNKENDAITRKFMQALLMNDRKTLLELGNRKAIDTSSDASGADAGYTIPAPLANEVMRIESVGYGVARQIFGYNLLTEGNTKRITALGSTLSVYWIDEGGKKKSSQPSFSIVTLALKKLAVIVPMTEEVIEDSGIDLTGLVAQLIREAFDKEEDLQFFMGDGTVWTGIFKDTTLPTNKVATANGDVSKLRPEEIIQLETDSPAGTSGSYLMHRTVLARIRALRMNADGTGDYIYNPLGNSGGTFANFDAGTLNGRPVILSEAAPTVAQATDAGGNNVPIMMYGDFKRGVAYGEKSDIRFKLLDQATITDTDDTTVLNLAEQDMIAIRAVKRVGFKVVLPAVLRRLVAAD